MREVEDAKWRDAAKLLGFALVDGGGKRVDADEATRAHRMHGTIDGRRVTLRYGLHDEEDGVVVIQVRLRKPLLLGISAQVSAPPRTATGKMLPGGIRTSIDAIEPARARELMQSEAGTKAIKLMEALGWLGWVELADSEVRVQCEGFTNAAEGYAELVRTGVEIAALAEKARESLPAAEWETKLRDALGKAAEELRIPFDRERLRVAGTSHDTRIEAGIDARDPSRLVCRIAFPHRLPAGSRVRRRTRFWSKVAALLRLDRPSSDRGFNLLFEASRPVRALLTGDVVTRIVTMSQAGSVDVDEEAVVHHVPANAAEAADAMPRVLALVRALSPGPEPSPYR